MGGISLYLTALVMGLAGSLHCLGMCGPIFIAASGFYDRPAQYARPLLLHHLGKLLTYAFIGIIMGIIGKGASLLWFQNQIMIFCGVLLLLFFVGSVFKISIAIRFNQWVVKSMGKTLNKSAAGGFLLGLVNGLVPCGLVYAAAVGALSTQSIAGGAVFMALFGLGTVPALSFVGFSRWILPLKKFRIPRIWRQAPMVILGVWLLLKGLGLGIPFISPDLSSHEPTKNCCSSHHR